MRLACVDMFITNSLWSSHMIAFTGSHVTVQTVCMDGMWQHCYKSQQRRSKKSSLTVHYFCRITPIGRVLAPARSRQASICSQDQHWYLRQLIVWLCLIQGCLELLFIVLTCPNVHFMDLEKPYRKKIAGNTESNTPTKRTTRTTAEEQQTEHNTGAGYLYW